MPTRTFHGSYFEAPDCIMDTLEHLGLRPRYLGAGRYHAGGVALEYRPYFANGVFVRSIVGSIVARGPEQNLTALTRRVQPLHARREGCGAGVHTESA